MKSRILLGLIALTCATTALQADIDVRVSVKFILGPNGQMPSNFNNSYGAHSLALTSFAAVQNNIEYANELLARFGRGHRLDLTEILTVSGQPAFFTNDASSGVSWAALEAAATANAAARAQFAWRNNAINIYINNTGGGYCSYPDDGNLILIGSDSLDAILPHEIGHYFDLLHTHDTHDEDDPLKVEDTLEDRTNWTRNRIATEAFGTTYANTMPWEKIRVGDYWIGKRTLIDNTWDNIMSYHDDGQYTVLTPDQMDRWTEAANGSRSRVVRGSTWFVDHRNACDEPIGDSVCRDGRGGPFPGLEGGLAAAGRGDVVLIRAGVYEAPDRLDQRVVLRNSRGRVVLR